ncbi:hypothetical protein OPV22_004777 [Ensete ventricosum]|uniref:Histidine-containing phosphotransfer protein n=1 Tax=Ensete ventricosum TaxID=4639 RepID=A0AAV8Q0U8_ENSVE|nr:hypothetical protein OPV22_004777 [Ensete ventricosum]
MHADVWARGTTLERSAAAVCRHGSGTHLMSQWDPGRKHAAARLPPRRVPNPAAGPTRRLRGTLVRNPRVEPPVSRRVTLNVGAYRPTCTMDTSGEEETRSLGAEETDDMELQRRYIDFTSTLFREGFLDGQYAQLRQLQDESNPEFVTEVIALFFQESEKLQDELSRTEDEEAVDFKKVDAHVHQLKGSSASVGAERVKNVCMAFRICCEEMNREGCLRCLQQVRLEYSLVPQMSAASAAGVFPGEEQAGDSVPAGAADRGRRWIHPSQ